MLYNIVDWVIRTPEGLAAFIIASVVAIFFTVAVDQEILERKRDSKLP